MRNLVIASLTALGLGGCASTGQVADAAVKGNLVQEGAQNQLLLLNILRAYDRKPMQLLSEILAFQNKGTEAPSTANIRLVP